MSKRSEVVASLVFLLVVFAMPVAVFAAATVSIGDAEIAPGENAAIPIIIKDVTGLGVADITITYDQSVVNVLGVANSDFDTLVPNIDNVAGVTQIGAMQMTNPGLDGSVVLAELTLEAVGGMEGCSTLTPGIIELKTIPGTNIPATELNGTFCIVGAATSATTTTTTTTTTPTTTTTISGGGGGGGGGAATSFEVRLMDMRAGQAVDQVIGGGGVPYLREISLTLSDDIYSSMVSVTDLEKKPWPDMAEPGAGVYRYFKVSYDKENYVESASFEFRVWKAWLVENDVDSSTVRMYRYTTVWNELPTESVGGDDGEWAYFRAETPGFSYFAIAAEKDSGFAPVVELAASATPEIGGMGKGAVETELQKPDEHAVTTAPLETPIITAVPMEEENGICGPTAILLLALLPIGVCRLLKK